MFSVATWTTAINVVSTSVDAGIMNHFYRKEIAQIPPYNHIFLKGLLLKRLSVLASGSNAAQEHEEQIEDPQDKADPSHFRKHSVKVNAFDEESVYEAVITATHNECADAGSKAPRHKKCCAAMIKESRQGSSEEAGADEIQTEKAQTHSVMFPQSMPGIFAAAAPNILHRILSCPNNTDREDLFQQTTTHLVDTGRYNGPCDLDLHHKYVQLIYAAPNLQAQIHAQAPLNDHLKANPHLKPKSCFGYVLNSDVLEPVYMSCVDCGQDALSKNYTCCRCMNEEPLVFDHKIGSPNPCKVRDSILGDPCSFEQMQKVNQEIYHPFRTMLNNGKKRKEYLAAIDKVVVLLHELNAFARDRRLVCESSWNNLECKENNRCGCRSDSPFFQYVQSSDTKHCVGLNGSICHIQFVIDTAGLFEKYGQCQQGKCLEAVQKLRCDTQSESQCKYYSGLVSAESSEKLEVLMWNLRTCGGTWLRQTSSGLRYQLEFPTKLIFFISNFIRIFMQLVSTSNILLM